MAVARRSIFAVLAVAAREANGHGFLVFPPMRGGATGNPSNQYCPQCGNGAGVCGDGGQWGSSDFLGAGGAPQATFTAGSVVEFEIKVTAHHRGHFEFSICDQQLGHSTVDPQGCLNRHKLHRAPPASDCVPNDSRGDCQPVHDEYPERWYLPPGAQAYKMRFVVPQDLSCTSCTLQWQWWTANSCVPAPDYGCYFSRMRALGWDADSWCGSFCGTCSSSLLQLNETVANGCGGEEFRNCADIAVVGGGGTTQSTTASTTAPPSPTSTTTAAPTTSATTAAPTTPTPAPPAPVPTPAGECVPQSMLTCINDYSGYWPKCSPGQTKSNVGPGGYEFGHYCTQEWTEALNEMLSDPVVNKCYDREAIRRFLAQVAYETGYYSTVYQPLDGGAGLIHMIPQNWPVNAQDMDALWPNRQYAEKVASMGKDFFQSSAYGWRSVAAWFKRSNGVIGGCGLDLFDQSYDMQTKCILGRVVDRSEPYNVVGNCMAQYMPEEPATTPAPTPPTTTAPAPVPPSTTVTTTSTTAATPCVPVLDCSSVDFCDAAGYATYCHDSGAAGECPTPFCKRASMAAAQTGRRLSRRQSFLGTALLQVQGTLTSSVDKSEEL